VEAANILLWDQLAVRKIEKKEKLDLIFNPKYSIPFQAECRTVFVCHGLDWYVEPKWSPWMDRMSHRHLFPRYVAKADKIIAVSNTVREHLKQFLLVDEDRVETVYLGVTEAFWQRLPGERLEEVRRSYNLPDRFFLYCGQIYPPKNFGRLVEAYAQVGPERGISLVVAGGSQWGKDCRPEMDLIDKLGISRWVIQPGWINHDTLPAFYAMAEALLLPSLYEACPSPLLEAMASNCPVVTANRYGTAELVGQAAVLVDPEGVESIADGMRRVVSDLDLRCRLIEAGRERARNFSWKKCAQETLQVLETVVAH
jgi:glycosyltransferase involved in cell wall biosynthesis